MACATTFGDPAVHRLADAVVVDLQEREANEVDVTGRRGGTAPLTTLGRAALVYTAGRGPAGNARAPGVL